MIDGGKGRTLSRDSRAARPMSWLTRLFGRTAPAPSRALVTIRCLAERESVSAGDDMLAPNEASFAIAVPSGDPSPALACIRTVVEGHDYLPRVEGGSTWIVSAEGRPVALATRDEAGARRVLPIPGAPAFAPVPPRLTLWFAYYLANDPDRIMRQLLAGEDVERIYGTG